MYFTPSKLLLTPVPTLRWVLEVGVSSFFFSQSGHFCSGMASRSDLRSQAARDREISKAKHSLQKQIMIVAFAHFQKKYIILIHADWSVYIIISLVN